MTNEKSIPLTQVNLLDYERGLLLISSPIKELSNSPITVSFNETDKLICKLEGIAVTYEKNKSTCKNYEENCLIVKTARQLIGKIMIACDDYQQYVNSKNIN